MSEQLRPILIIDEDLSPILKKLQKGRIIKGRIVLVLENNHYLLRILGHNLVMKSHLKFQRSQEVLCKVLEAKPKLTLRLIDPQREFFVRTPFKTNLLIE